MESVSKRSAGEINPQTGKKYTRAELAAEYNATKPAKPTNT